MRELTHFERTRIQMEYAVPLIRDLQELLGEEVVNAALEQRARRQEEAVEPGGRPDFGRMAEGAEMFAAGGALDYEIIASSSDRFDMDVHRCGYAEMMDELGGRSFGHLLVCRGDFAAARRIGMTLSRTRTIMEGGDCCDFRYRPAGEELG